MAYVANEFTRRLVEDGMSTGLTNTHTTHGVSDLYHLLARKQCILCPAWLPYITLCYIGSRFFLPLEQSRTDLLGCCLAASRPREAARW